MTRQCSKASAPIQLPNGKEVEQVDPRTDTGNGGPDGSAADQKNEIGADGSAQTPERSRQPHACILTGVNRILIEPNEGAQTGNEYRSRRRDPETTKGRHMSHLVDIDGDDQTQTELPAKGRPIDS